jgi:hypothetical protein
VSDAAQPTLVLLGDGEARRAGRDDDRGDLLATVALPVTAVTVMRSVIAVPELVMKLFAPLITHSPPSSRAVVRVAPASEHPPAR